MGCDGVEAELGLEPRSADDDEVKRELRPGAKINDYFIENIIIYTNYIVIDNSIKLKDRIKKLKNYINRINNLKLSFEFKIHLYIFFIKNYNNIEFDDNTLSTIINFIKIN